MSWVEGRRRARLAGAPTEPLGAGRQAIAAELVEALWPRKLRGDGMATDWTTLATCGKMLASKGSVYGQKWPSPRAGEEGRRAILDHLLQAQESERSRLALELHDDTIQVLCALLLQVDGMIPLAKRTGGRRR